MIWHRYIRSHVLSTENHTSASFGSKGKLILIDFKNILTGKKGCGRYIHKAIVEYGSDNFIVQLLEEGDFQHIWRREIEESKKHLFHKGMGYNGNCGRAIYNDPATMKKIMEKTKLKRNKTIMKYKKWAMENRQFMSDKRKKYLENLKLSDPEKVKSWNANRSKARKNKTKETHNNVAKQANSMRLRAKNPTEHMLNGNKKRSSTMKGRCGSQAKAFSGYYVTPFGKFESLLQCRKITGIAETSILFLCKGDRKISLLRQKYLMRLSCFKNFEFSDKTSRELGFFFIPKNRNNESTIS